MQSGRKWRNDRRNKENQQIARGWSDADIDEVIDNHPGGTAPAIDRTPKPNQPATVYYRLDGHYVIVNDISGEIVQLSDRKDNGWIDEQTNQEIAPRIPSTS